MPLRPRQPSFVIDRERRVIQTVTAFVDLLGLSNALVRLDAIIEEDLDKERSLPIIRESLGAILALRRIFEESFDLLARPEAPAGLDESQKALWESSRNGETRLYWFSDCALVNQTVDLRNALACYREVLFLLHSLAFCTLGLAARGQLLRGGVDMGVALDSGSEEVLGSGLVHAHRLESVHASPPRIRIGPRFFSFLAASDSADYLLSVGCPSEHLAPIRNIVGIVRELVHTDPDGIPRLHFMSPHVLGAFAHESSPTLMENARAAITEKLGHLDPNTEADLVAKYGWMRSALSEG